MPVNDETIPSPDCVKDAETVAIERFEAAVRVLQDTIKSLAVFGITAEIVTNEHRVLGGMPQTTIAYTLNKIVASRGYTR